MSVVIDTQIVPAIPGKKIYTGSGSFGMLTGKLKLKAHNDNIIDIDVPEGKTWAVQVTVSITESDV